jgi:hypothetical protein
VAEDAGEEAGKMALEADCIKDGRIRINRRCRDKLREINLYR